MDGFINALARAQDTVLPMPERVHSTDSWPFKVTERVLALSPRKLKAHRVVSFDGGDKITRAFDVLRNVCMKDLTPRVADRLVIGVTSPSAKSGVSTTAINLALSLARQKKGGVLLADMAPADRGSWHRMGLARKDVEFCLQRDSIVPLRIAGMTIHATSLLPYFGEKTGGETDAALHRWAAGIWRQLGNTTIVLDLPPLLSDDRVGALIAELDLVVLVLATSKSSLAELEICKSYLHDAARVQLVLNKARSYDL